ncbi:heme oxygenase [Acetobacter pasteurianus NBRC 101655]|uniref:biliverdin-producing heme oxygenase n=2 Tax=Acetobacter pasteurianus TaxID=438 RepID=UPI00024579FA|nr:biliverdin-producing heme oxygenase [Acetobacter pasteurianus]BAU38447.1 heme oxygenase [Acetobacter pasteurianus NBRC 101655]CCT58345.1 heme oxygenase [Acetobacter pasteurianus 386B]
MTKTSAPLSLCLKEATHTLHVDLDKSIMAHGLFSSADKYKNFVQLQYLFHRDINDLYNHDQLVEIIPDLASRNRFAQVCQDMQDLNLPLPDEGPSMNIQDASTAIGWLYVAEGSKLGANFLTKLVEKLGFTENFGGRHLAADPGGRGPSWNAFKSAIDLAGFDPVLATAGAQAGFMRVKNYMITSIAT